MDFVKRTYAAIAEINNSLRAFVEHPTHPLQITYDLTENDFKAFPDLTGVVMAFCRGQESKLPTRINFYETNYPIFQGTKPWNQFRAELILEYRDYRYVLQSVTLPNNIAKLNRWEN